MTCEVLLMNLKGAALAADSAVTMVEVDSGRRILSQAGNQKVFLLDEAGPVGVMTYAAGDFAGYPWEVVFKTFAQSVAGQRLTVQDMTERLVAFLSGADQGEAGGIIVSEASEIQALEAYLEGLAQRWHVLTQIHAGGNDRAARAAALDAAFAQLEQEIRFRTDYLSEEVGAEDESQKPRDAQFAAPPARLAAFLEKHLNPRLERWIGGLGLPAAQRERLWTLAVESLAYDWLPPASRTAGVVLAGYGPTDMVPVYVQLRILGAFGGMLKFRCEDYGAPSAQGHRAVVVESYAQDELIEAFLHGAQPSFMNNAYLAMSGAVGAYFDEALRAAKGHKALTASLTEIGARARNQAPVAAIRAAVMVQHKKMHRTLVPLLESASIEALAKFAGQLVQLSVIEHELTGDGSVARPVTILRMTKGHHTLSSE